MTNIEHSISELPMKSREQTNEIQENPTTEMDINEMREMDIQYPTTGASGKNDTSA